MPEINSLDDLWDHVNETTRKNFPGNRLMPILGGGKERNPRFMIVFINPTFRNISSDRNWEGPRFPFIGRKRPWIEFHEAGFFDESLLDYIRKNPRWSVGFTNMVLEFLRDNGLYLTNIVKNTSGNADLPKADQINLYLPFFRREIELVNPDYIIAFGLIPINALLNEKIRLSDYYDDFKRTGELNPYDIEINSKKFKVIPCYYPIGRGNPERAIEILKKIAELR
jgi:uracil-DNA glycosylase family 4